MCSAKALAERNSVIAPDHNCKTVPALSRTQTGVKAKVRVEGPVPEQDEGRTAAGPPRAIWEKKKKKKPPLLYTENAYVQQSQHPYRCSSHV